MADPLEIRRFITWVTMPSLIAVGQTVKAYVWKNWVIQGHSRSSELTRIDRVPMTSSLPSIVTMRLACTVTKILTENREFFLPRVFNVPVEGFYLKFYNARWAQRLD